MCTPMALAAVVAGGRMEPGGGGRGVLRVEGRPAAGAALSAQVTAQVEVRW